MQEGKIAAIMIGIASLMLSTISQAKMHALSEVKSFLKKNPTCYLAVGYLTPGPTFKSGEPDMNDEVYCVSDLRVNIGTINEAAGCVFARYNIEYNSFISPYDRHEDPDKGLHKSGFPMVSGKSCANGGFEKLLKLFPGSIHGNTVLDALTKGPVFSMGVYLLYAEDSSQEKWWNKNVKKRGPKNTNDEQKPDCADKDFAANFPLKCISEKELINEYCKAAETTKNSLPGNLTYYQQEQDVIGEIYKKRFKKELSNPCP